MKKIVALGVFFLLFGISACNHHSELDFNAQLEKDVATIDAYLTSRGITAVKDTSGVRYVITTQGTGLKPLPVNGSITVKYTAKLLGNTTAFDSSNGVLLELNNVIKAWQIVLPLINKGSKFVMYAPSGLAYGTTGSGSTVPPDSNIEFDVELLDDDLQLATDVVKLDVYVDSVTEALHLTDVIKDPRGFRYYVTSQGDGENPISTSTVTVTYKGYTLDNKVFADQTTNAVSAPLTQLLLGWQLALPYIPEGSTFTLFLPSGMGYGPSGYGTVGPNENLVFEIKLVSVD